MVTPPDGRDPDPGGRDRDPGGRDRDPGGRARNARPRDALGRPLPKSAAGDGPGIPDDLVIAPAEAAVLGGRLLAEGRPFHAHEVFEAAWKSLDGPDRELWRGLAQVAVGVTHARRGNATGAVTLLRRGAATVAATAARDPSGATAVDPSGATAGDPNVGGASGAPPGVDPGFVAAQAEGMAGRIERDGLGAVSEAELRLPLSPG